MVGKNERDKKTTLPQLLPPEVFLETFKHVPRLAVNVLVFNSQGQPALVKRSIEPLKDHWHMPGGFQLKRESLQECIKRIAKKELGIDLNPEEATLLGAFDDLDKDPRGHVVDLVYRYNLGQEENVTPTEENKEIRFFTTLPKKIGFNHGDVLHELGIM